jgi:hypothetical protein
LNLSNNAPAVAPRPIVGLARLAFQLNRERKYAVRDGEILPGGERLCNHD